MQNPVGDLHIDDFCKDIAKTFILLYKRFPKKTALYVEDISGPDEPDEFGLHSQRFEAGFSALVWLKESGYIWYGSTVRQEAIEEATLSHRGFTFLSSFDRNSHSDIGSKNIRRIDCIKAALKNVSSEELKSLILRYMIESRDFN